MFGLFGGMNTGGVDLIPHVLCYFSKRGPNQYSVPGFGLEIAILTRTTLFYIWCVKGVKFSIRNTLQKRAISAKTAIFRPKPAMKY